MCVAKVIDGRISVSEQLLRGGGRTDRTASDDANGERRDRWYFQGPPTGRGHPPSLVSTHKASIIVTTLTGQNSRVPPAQPPSERPW